MTLPITTIFVSLLSLWLIVLSANIVRQRGSAKVSMGDGGDEPLLRKIRAQANFVEYSPFMAMMVALAELQNGNAYIIGALAAIFLFARLAHGYALSFTANFPRGRFWGAALSFLSLVVMALHNILMLAIG